jgi:hypothetical protein
MLERRDAIDVSIITAAWLPKASTNATTFADRDSRKPFGGVSLEPRYGKPSRSLLDGALKSTDVHAALARRHDQMDVLWHNYPGQQVDGPFASQVGKRLDKPPARAITSQKR